MGGSPARRRHSMWRRRRSERNAGAARHAACTHRRQVLLMEQYVGRRHLRRRCSHRSLRRRGRIHGRCTALHQQCASHVEGGPVPKRSLTHTQTFGRYAGSLYPSCRPDAPRRHDGDRHGCGRPIGRSRLRRCRFHGRDGTRSSRPAGSRADDFSPHVLAHRPFVHDGWRTHAR